MEIIGDVIVYYVAASPNDEKRAVKVRISDGSDETTLPETSVPETTVPETSVPETSFVETEALETSGDETVFPESIVPETTDFVANSLEDTEKNKITEPFGCKISVCVTLIPALVALGACLIKRKE